MTPRTGKRLVAFLVSATVTFIASSALAQTAAPAATPEATAAPGSPPPEVPAAEVAQRWRGAARGLYFSGELGAMTFLGDIGKASKTGVVFGVRSGYDLFSWLAVGVHVVGATNPTDFMPPPDASTFQSFYYGAEGRVALRIGRASIIGQGGYGIMQLGSNILETVGAVPVGSRFSGAFSAGLAFDWHTKNRHFSFGLTADAIVPQSFGATAALGVMPYVQYTH